VVKRRTVAFATLAAMCSSPRPGAAGADFADVRDAAALMRQARALAGAGDGSVRLLSGKRLALLSPCKGDHSALEFVQAATALGAHVSVVQPGLSARSSEREIDETARMLGQLYDAVECQHLPAALVGRLARSAGIPVFAGLATAEHPITALADALGGEVPPDEQRCRILQAALLISIS